MALSLTTEAVRRVRELRQENGLGEQWLRLGVRGGGCSGLSYFMDFVDGPTDKDKTFEFEGVHVCVDVKSYLFVNGIEVHYEATDIHAGFEYRNPNASRSCSCGTSFAV